MSQATLWQRLEGLVTLVVSLVLYSTTGASWWMFALLLLAPDLSMAGYALGNRAGQTIYNVVHTYVFPLLLALAGYWIGNDLVLALALIWIAHIGMDRALGYGLKEEAGFKYTHLGTLGSTQKA
jgi:hypothetical protein